MATMDLLSYERDSRWMPHLSWTHLDGSLQERMERQAGRKELAWQKIADKLGPLLVMDGGSLGQSDYIVKDYDQDQDSQERAYEKAPLLGNQIMYNHNQNNKHHQSSYQTRAHLPYTRYVDVGPIMNSKSPSPTGALSKISSHRNSNQNMKQQQQQQLQHHRSHHNQQHLEDANAHNNRYECESLKKAKRRCWTVSSVLVMLVVLLFTIVMLMAFGILKYSDTIPKITL